MWNRRDLKINAKASLKQNYWKAVVASLLLMISAGSGAAASAGSTREEVDATLNEMAVEFDTETLLTVMVVILTACAVIGLISTLVSIFVMNPLQIGVRKMFVNCKDNSVEFGDAAFGFKNSYLNIVKIKFLKGLFISLWLCLFIIPGFIKAYEYCMIDYIIAENPGMSSKEAFAKSKKMMTGNKWKAFVLDLSFLGWHLLAACTCGIAEIFYVAPYYHLTQAELYHTLKTEQKQQ